MEFSIKSGNPEKQRTACVVVGVFEPRKLCLPGELLDNAVRGYLSDIIRRGDMDGKAETSLLLHNVPGTLCDRVLLVGLGKEKEFREGAYGRAIRTAVRTLNETGSFDATIFLTEVPVKKRNVEWRIRQAVIAAQEAVYRFDQFKSKKDEIRRPLRKLTLTVERRTELAEAEEALGQGLAIAEGMNLAKNLGNLPGNVCTPTYLAETALKMAQENGIECQILERADMEALGMNALLSVAKGSHQPPKLIVLHYPGAAQNANDAPLVLIGKGVTFDTGGISLKPPSDMDEMKYDMCGAATVLGTLLATAQMKLPIKLSVIIPATENMPGGSASRPGDIVTSMSGQTVEILNTDAEGRLILCDALTYAERFEPTQIIDVATLTGACVVALGHVSAGLFSNDDGLARDLMHAGESAHDRAWQMPLWEDYQELLKSPFADMANIGGRWGGSITAACFLSRFVKKIEWAHLDVAGVAWKSGADKGATARPVPLLMYYLLKRAGKLN
ncbi:MAG: leucyl aminopeptidase [Pseudomonadota bacterium]